MKLSIPGAAAEAGISKEAWGNIELGREHHGGQIRDSDGKPETVAHMARVVGVTPEQLGEDHREDAAEVLREIIRREDGPRREYDDPGLQRIWETSEGLPEGTRRELVRVAAGMRGVRVRDRGTGRPA